MTEIKDLVYPIYRILNYSKMLEANLKGMQEVGAYKAEKEERFEMMEYDIENLERYLTVLKNTYGKLNREKKTLFGCKTVRKTTRKVRRT